VGSPPLRDEAGEPGQQAEIHDHRRRLGARRRSAAATLSELGYNVRCYCYQDSPRRAHSIAAQGGINAAKNYQNDGDSIQRLFYDTIKGGDFRAREGNVYRLAQISVNIIDQCVAQGVPFAREYGDCWPTGRSAGRRSRAPSTRAARPASSCCSARTRRWRRRSRRRVTMFPRAEMLDLIVVNGRARGIVVRDELTGKIEPHLADAVVLATGGLRQRVLPVDEREGLQRDGDLARLQARRGVRESVLHADPPDVHSPSRASTSRSSR
jgi:succinate dehydrogenase/fumarate reductase flavoprotein subunit